MAVLSSVYVKRQSCSDDPYLEGCDDTSDQQTNNGYSWWWSPTGMGVRYAIVAILFLALLALLVGGYSHAQRRLRRGQPPLRYHRWMLARRHYARGFYDTNQTYAHYANQNGQAYGMTGQPAYAPPPPAYNHYDAPPVYQPPEGGSKIMADQTVHEVRRAGESSGDAGLAAPPPAHQ